MGWAPATWMAMATSISWWAAVGTKTPARRMGKRSSPTGRSMPIGKSTPACRSWCGIGPATSGRHHHRQRSRLRALVVGTVATAGRWDDPVEQACHRQRFFPASRAAPGRSGRGWTAGIDYGQTRFCAQRKRPGRQGATLSVLLQVVAGKETVPKTRN